MSKIETQVALGSSGMTIMFMALILSFFYFLIGPKDNGQDLHVDPTGVLIQSISISGAPSLILAGTVFGLGKSYGTIHSATILIITGIILIAGMIFATWISIPEIKEQFIVSGADLIPYIFIVAGISIAILGSYLLRKSKNYRNLEDEIH
jgi:hypothetical protein